MNLCFEASRKLYFRLQWLENNTPALIREMRAGTNNGMQDVEARLKRTKQASPLL